jgi:ATP-dependent protease HslVU (ClpYQ) peptidase subunit
MTTIVYCTKTKTLYTDGRCTTNNDIIEENWPKAFNIRDHNIHVCNKPIKYAAFSGNVQKGQHILNHILEHGTEDIQDIDDEHVDLLLITTDGDCYQLINNNWMLDHCKYVVLGSGTPYAQSALHLGFKPKDAIKHAAELDSCTNKRIKVYKV